MHREVPLLLAPLPLVPASLEQLCLSQFFTKLDLCSTYNLVHIRDGDEWKTTIRATSGHYEYCMMPYGFSSTPSVFQRLNNDVQRDMQGKFVIAYMHDILVYSSSLESHVNHVH